MRSDISNGNNLTRMMVMWALVLGTFFGLYGGFIYQAAEEDMAVTAVVPSYVSPSAQ